MLKQTNNLIHCITNPISINDCANLILALGAKPIMACHPDEVDDITLVDLNAEKLLFVSFFIIESDEISFL